MAADVTSPPTVLAVGDDLGALATVARAVAKLGYRNVSASNAFEMPALLERERADVAVLDLDLALLGGVELAILARRSAPGVVRIAVTGAASLELAMRAVNEAEVFRLFRKPLALDETMAALAAGVRHRQGVRAATDAELLVSRREQLLSGLESEHPGITHRPPRAERRVLRRAATREAFRGMLRAGWLKMIS